MEQGRMKEFSDISDEKNFLAMYDAYKQIIYSYVLTKIGDTFAAEDLTEDVFFKALNKRFTYNPRKAQFSTWIFTIAKNALIDYYRKMRPSVDIDDKDEEAPVPSETDTEEEFFAAVKSETLKKALAELSPREYNVVYMRYYRDLSYRQIAMETALSESNVSVILTRSLKKLKKMLESEV
jgi:RNA polymerase sigma-70 factor (ECF subfamily)